MDEATGWLWAVVVIVGMAVLAAALVYGIIVWRSRRKDPAVKQMQNEVVREHYRRNE